MIFSSCRLEFRFAFGDRATVPFTRLIMVTKFDRGFAPLCGAWYCIRRSVPSPKTLRFRRRSVGCFSRRERSAHIWIDTGRASNAEKQPTGCGPEGCVENGPAAALLVGYV